MLHGLGLCATNHLLSTPKSTAPTWWKSGHWRQEQELQQTFGGNRLGLTPHLSNTYLFGQHWIKGDTNGCLWPTATLQQNLLGTPQNLWLQKGKAKDFKFVSNKNKVLLVLQMSHHPQLLLSSLMISNVIWQRGWLPWQPNKSIAGCRLDCEANTIRSCFCHILYPRAQAS